MKLPLTTHALRGDLQRLVKRIVRRAIEDYSESLARVATKLGRDATIVERWVSEKRDAVAEHEKYNAPLWVLADREALSDETVAAIVKGIWEMRHQQPKSGVVLTVEGAVFGLMGRCGEMVHRGSVDLADGKLTLPELLADREKAVDVHKSSGQTIEAIDAALAKYTAGDADGAAE